MERPNEDAGENENGFWGCGPSFESKNAKESDQHSF